MLLIETSLRHSGIHGIGVFADEDIKPATLIWEYDKRVDMLIHEWQMDDYPMSMQKHIYQHAEWFQNRKLYILSGDNDRFMNHSDKPNTQGFGTEIIASCFIPKDTEITCDYRICVIRSFTLEPNDASGSFKNSTLSNKSRC